MLLHGFTESKSERTIKEHISGKRKIAIAFKLLMIVGGWEARNRKGEEETGKKTENTTYGYF